MFSSIVAISLSALLESTSGDSSAIGCRSKAGRTVVPHNIYACPGTFSSNGVYGAEATYLCSDGYEVCQSAQAAAAMGLTEEICYDENIFTDRNQFFASKETSNGYGRCYSGQNQKYVSGQNNANDIWGCGHPNPTLPLRNFDCKVNGKTVMKKMMSTWKDNAFWKYGDAYNEATTMQLTSATSGGVLCCRKGPATDSSCYDQINSVCCKFGNVFGSNLPQFYGTQCGAKMVIRDQINALHPMLQRKIGSPVTIFNNYCDYPVHDCGADPSVIVGCRSMSGRTVIPGNIYACPGTFFDGGLHGAGADYVCSDGYEVCESAQAAAALGLTEEICYDEDIFKDRNQFFASKETNYGYGRCYSGKDEPYIPGQTDVNDIWGCGHPNPTLPLSNFDCKVNGRTVMKMKMTTWKHNACWNDDNEEAIIHLTCPNWGGVLCCRK